MSMSRPPRVTIETTVENIPEAMLEAGFRPGQQVRIQVEYIDVDTPEAAPENGTRKGNRLEKLLALKGAGARLHGPRSAEEIDAEIREFRGDE